MYFYTSLYLVSGVVLRYDDLRGLVLSLLSSGVAFCTFWPSFVSTGQTLRVELPPSLILGCQITMSTVSAISANSLLCVCKITLSHSSWGLRSLTQPSSYYLMGCQYSHGDTSTLFGVSFILTTSKVRLPAFCTLG